MLTKFSVGGRLFFLTLGMMLLTGVIGAAGIFSMANTVDSLGVVYGRDASSVAKLGQIQRLLDANFTEMLRATQHDPDGKLAKLHDHPVSEHLGRIEKNQAEINRLWEEYRQKTTEDGAKALIPEFDKNHSEWLNGILMPSVEAFRAGNFSPEVVERFLKGNRKIGDSTRQSLLKLIDFHQGAAKVEFETAQDGFAKLKVLLSALVLFGIIAGSLLSFLTIRSITLPLAKMRQTILEVEATKNLSLRTSITTQDEVGQTAASFDQFIASLQETIGTVTKNVAEVSSAAHALAMTASEVAQSSEQQSTAAASMAATVEEITVSINLVADSARDASGASEESGQLASDGKGIIHEASEGMREIANTVRGNAQTISLLGEQSNEISAVVQVIKDVAEQTNLLALNAAIEAARAGEQGRGFAVVADEVRKLAERTSSATAEISQMIGRIQQTARDAVDSMGDAVAEVEAGVALADQAGNSINQIESGAGHVVRVVSGISSALAEQSSASAQMSKHIEEVAQMVERNSTAATDAAAAAKRLEQLADSMTDSIHRFRI